MSNTKPMKVLIGESSKEFAEICMETASGADYEVKLCSAEVNQLAEFGEKIVILLFGM